MERLNRTRVSSISRPVLRSYVIDTPSLIVLLLTDLVQDRVGHSQGLVPAGGLSPTGDARARGGV